MSNRPNNSIVQKAAWENNKSIGTRFLKVRESRAKIPFGQVRMRPAKKGTLAVRVLRSLAGRWTQKPERSQAA